MAIQQFAAVTERSMIYGHIAMMLGKYDMAQDFFLSSSRPQLALDMRCDIQDWITALRLAKQIDPKQEPIICKRLASLIESQGTPIYPLIPKATTMRLSDSTKRPS